MRLNNERMWWKKWFSKKVDNAGPEVAGDLRAVVISDLGCVRQVNEDAARFIRPSAADVRRAKGFLAVVADGMGGHAAGEVASQIAVETVARVYFERKETPEESLYLALTRANRDIWQAAARSASRKGMGTTCTALSIVQMRLYLAHVGDSRAYLLQKGRIFQLSKDHTYVQSLVDQGVITSAEAGRHAERNVLTRAMGTHGKVEIDISSPAYHFEEGDRLLLCTDGLYDYLSDDEIAAVLLTPALSESARQLIDMARQRGGHDNLTALLIERVPPGTFHDPRPTANVGQA